MPDQQPGTQDRKPLNSQGSVNSAVKSICDMMRRSNRAGAMQYVPELTWILFLHILDEQEEREAQEAAALSIPFTPSLKAPYRWQDWAAPDRKKRTRLVDPAMNAFFGFVNGEASIARADVLVAFNLRHLANEWTERRIAAVNLQEGYQPLRIRTPEEVPKYGD